MKQGVFWLLFVAELVIFAWSLYWFFNVWGIAGLLLGLFAWWVVYKVGTAEV